MGLAGAEEVEIWAVEEEDFLGWHFDGFCSCNWNCNFWELDRIEVKRKIYGSINPLLHTGEETVSHNLWC